LVSEDSGKSAFFSLFICNNHEEKMKNISEITNEKIKDQINEYHLMVAEILS